MPETIELSILMSPEEDRAREMPPPLVLAELAVSVLFCTLQVPLNVNPSRMPPPWCLWPSAGEGAVADGESGGEERAARVNRPAAGAAVAREGGALNRQRAAVDRHAASGRRGRIVLEGGILNRQRAAVDRHAASGHRRHIVADGAAVRVTASSAISIRRPD